MQASEQPTTTSSVGETPKPSPITTNPPITTESASTTPTPPDVVSLQMLMLSLVNQDRRANGLTDLAWDNAAATAGMLHAEEMASLGYVSHWNLDGYGPDARYSEAGGRDTVQENVYLYWPDTGVWPKTPGEWTGLVRQVEQTFMLNETHRKTILAPEHTHVGIGIAYEPASGRLAVAQEFIAHYVVLQPLATRSSLGATIPLVGTLVAGASLPSLTLAYEPFPEPFRLSQLEQTEAFASPATDYAAVELTPQEDGVFQHLLVLDHEGRSGLYHVRLTVDTVHGRIRVVDVVIEVE